VKFKEAGLADNLNIDYLLSANTEVTCTCVTNSGRCPKAANKVTFDEQLSTAGTFSPKNGSVSATLVLTPGACPSSQPPTCGGGQKLELSAITYNNIALTDETNHVSASGLPRGPL